MKLFTLYQTTTLICLGLGLMKVKAQLQAANAADNTLKCQQQFDKQSDYLKADNELLQSRLEQMEKSLQDQKQQEREVEEELLALEMKLQTVQTLLMQQQTEDHQQFKDNIESLKARKCKRLDTIAMDIQNFSYVQNSISNKIAKRMQCDNESSNRNEDDNQFDALPQDNANFCDNLYTKTLQDISGNVSTLQVIDDKLKGFGEKFINESQLHTKTIEALPEVMKQLEAKDKSAVCVRTKNKTTICSPHPYPTNCYQNDSPHCSEGKCLIKNFIYGPEPFEVSCDQINDVAGGIVIQRRIDGTENFYRNWSDYKIGFGDLDGEFWLGLDKIHALTVALAPVELIIQMQDHDDVMKYAKYSEFAIGNETELYELKVIKGYEGNAGDSFSYHKGLKFTTKDKDNDESYAYNCAKAKTGAWWYKNCHWSNLNAVYYEDGIVPDNEIGRGICWYTFRGYAYSLKFVQMMLRPKNDILSDIDAM